MAEGAMKREHSDPHRVLPDLPVSEAAAAASGPSSATVWQSLLPTSHTDSTSPLLLLLLGV